LNHTSLCCLTNLVVSFQHVAEGVDGQSNGREGKQLYLTCLYDNPFKKEKANDEKLIENKALGEKNSQSETRISNYLSVWHT